MENNNNNRRSSAIKSYYYNATHKALFVTFTNNKMYVYYGVTRGHFMNLSKAQSKGSYINEYIKPNYNCKLIFNEF